MSQTGYGLLDLIAISIGTPVVPGTWYRDPEPLQVDSLCDSWKVPIDRRPPTKIEPKISNLRTLSMHPDGKRIAFTLGKPIAEQVWMMENYLLPAIENKK